MKPTTPVTPATQKSQKGKAKNENGIKSASKISQKPSGFVENDVVANAKAKRKSLPNNMPSAKKAKLKRHSIANLKTSSGFIEEDV